MNIYNVSQKRGTSPIKFRTSFVIHNVSTGKTKFKPQQRQMTNERSTLFGGLGYGND